MNQKSQVGAEKMIGVDLHPDSFSLAVTEPDSSDSLHILQQITMAPTSKWCETLDKLPRPTVIVCEAGNNSFVLMKMADRLGFRTCILNSIDVERFANPKKLVANLGAAPCIHQSGCREYSTGVQRDGRYMA